MQISDILKPEAVKTLTACTSKKRLFHDLGDIALFLRLEKPLDFDAVDRQPVDLVFALLAPENAGVEHLKALALVSRTMRDPDMRAKLRANADASTLHTILTAAQAQAA